MPQDRVSGLQRTRNTPHSLALSEGHASIGSAHQYLGVAGAAGGSIAVDWNFFLEVVDGPRPDPRKRKSKNIEVIVLYALAVLMGVAMIVVCATVMVIRSLCVLPSLTALDCDSSSRKVERTMGSIEHMYELELGQSVSLQSALFNRDAARGACKVTKQLPERDGALEYQFKRPGEPHERVVKERDLSAG
jgi:hypothetical protein